jgi:uncharacterized UPF0160 family protein
MTEEVAAKCARRNAKIGTHNGSFHCDEVLACFMLTCLPEYKDADIIRFCENYFLHIHLIAAVWHKVD